MHERSRTHTGGKRVALAFAALSLFLVLPAQALAAGGWQARMSGTTSDLGGLAATAGHLWAVGAAGTILTTQNGGVSWAAEASGAAQDLHGVAFADASHGWAVGAAGTILATSDGGANWAAQSSGTSATLYGVACSGAQNAWAIGDGGTILATSDGGASWVAQSSGTAQRPAWRRLRRCLARLGRGRRRHHSRHQQRRRELGGAELGHHRVAERRGLRRRFARRRSRRRRRRPDLERRRPHLGCRRVGQRPQTSRQSPSPVPRAPGSSALPGPSCSARTAARHGRPRSRPRAKISPP